MSSKYLNKLLFVILTSWLLLCCQNSEQKFDSRFLKGEWQLYGTASSGKDLFTNYQPNDPTLTLKFFDIDSIKYFNRMGIYISKEDIGELDVFVSDSNRQIHYRHRVLKVDTSELWLMELLDDGAYLEMRFNRIIY